MSTGSNTPGMLAEATSTSRNSLRAGSPPRIAMAPKSQMTISSLSRSVVATHRSRPVPASRERLSTVPRTGVRWDLDGGHHLSSRRIEGDPLQSLPLEGRTIRRMHDGGARELHVGHSEAPRRIPERSAGRASQLWHERPQFHLLTRTGGGASLDDRGGGALRHREALL